MTSFSCKETLVVKDILALGDKYSQLRRRSMGSIAQEMKKLSHAKVFIKDVSKFTKFSLSSNNF